MNTLKDLHGKLQALRAEQAKAFDSHKDDAGNLKAMAPEVIEQIRQREAEMKDVGAKYLEMKELSDAKERNERELKAMGEYVSTPTNRLDFATEQKSESKIISVGDAFVNSAEYKAHQGRFSTNTKFSVELPNAEFKTTFTEGTSFTPPNFRLPIVVPSAQRPAKIQDYIPTTVTSERSAIKYMLETTFTNNSANTSEGSALSESALAYTEQSVPIELIGTYLPVTEQAMEDIAQVTALINNRLSLMLAQTKETEILTGNGSTPHFTGFLNASGLQTQAKGADDTYTAIYKGINKVNNTGYANASLVVLNSAEAVTVFTTKDANGNFIYGNPGVFNPNNSSIWGLPILVTNAETAGTALVGDFNLYSQYYQSRGARVDVGLDSDNFTKNKLTVKITERGALVIYRGAAFCQVTGL